VIEPIAYRIYVRSREEAISRYQKIWQEVDAPVTIDSLSDIFTKRSQEEIDDISLDILVVVDPGPAKRHPWRSTSIENVSPSMRKMRKSST
jgi:hypothetical protein